MSLTIAFDTDVITNSTPAIYKGAATLTINFEIPEADIEKLHTLFVYEECGCDFPDWQLFKSGEWKRSPWHACVTQAQHIQHTVESVIWGHLTRGKYDEYCA